MRHIRDFLVGGLLFAAMGAVIFALVMAAWFLGVWASEHNYSPAAIVGVGGVFVLFVLGGIVGLKDPPPKLFGDG